MKYNWEIMYVGDDGEEMNTFYTGTRAAVTTLAQEMEEEGYGYIEIFQLDADED